MMDTMQQQQQHQPNQPGGAPPGFVLNNLCRNNNNLILDNLQQLGGDLSQHMSAHQEGAHGTSFSTSNMTLATDILGFHTNPINLGVNAEFTVKSKTLPKGNKKRAGRQMTTNNMERHLPDPSTSARSRNPNDGDEGEGEAANLNLASASSVNVRSKSTSKFFEALKENVRCEVSNLIETNDLRPYFLIQLFRDLQMMSSSDPTRHQTLQSIQNMYNRYVESTIQDEARFGEAGRSGQHREEESTMDEDYGQAVSTDDMDNRMLVNDLRMESKTDNEMVTRDGSRRDNTLEESIRRRRCRNRMNELVNKQNFLEQRLGLTFPTSSGSSHSTPVVSEVKFCLLICY